MHESQKVPVTYLFAPLCGWYHGAVSSIHRLNGTYRAALTMAPTELFCGSGAHPLDASFAAHALANDGALQPLPAALQYRLIAKKVLSAIGAAFDSGFVRLSLYAFWQLDLRREREALEAAQYVCFVHGRDMSCPAALAKCVGGMGLAAATRACIVAGARVTDATAACGVPILVANVDRPPTLLRSGALYAGFETLLSAVGWPVRR